MLLIPIMWWYVVVHVHKEYIHSFQPYQNPYIESKVSIRGYIKINIS